MSLSLTDVASTHQFYEITITGNNSRFCTVSLSLGFVAEHPNSPYA